MRKTNKGKPNKENPNKECEIALFCMVLLSLIWIIFKLNLIRRMK